MRRILLLVLSGSILAACSGGPSRREQTTAAAETSTGTPSPAPTSTPAAIATAAAAAQTATAVQADVMIETVRLCITPALADDAGTAANQLDSCLNRGEGGFAVAGIEGPLPVMLVEVSHHPGDCRADAAILWYAGGWRIQYATSLLPDPVNSRLLGAAAPGGATNLPLTALARETADGSTTLLSVLVGTARCGSGPGIVPILFALDHDAWRLAWDQHGTDMQTLSDTEARFTEDTGDTVQVRGALLWGPWDPASAAKIFHESHPGPHRYATQTWTRDGQRYVGSPSQVEMSAYNALINFVYRLSTGDEAGAAKLLADASLLETAKQLGLIQQPLGQEWMTNLDANIECCGPIHILSGLQWKSGPPQPLVVTFVQRGADWLISGIARE